MLLARVANDLSEDPWREATMSASGLNVVSTAEQPIMISDGERTLHSIGDPLDLVQSALGEE